MEFDIPIPMSLLVAGAVVVGASIILSVVVNALKVVAFFRIPGPTLPCKVGDHRYMEVKKELSDHAERLTGIAKRNHELRRELEDKIDKFVEKSEESDKRITSRLNDISSTLSEMKGIIKIVCGKIGGHDE